MPRRPASVHGSAPADVAACAPFPHDGPPEVPWANSKCSRPVSPSRKGHAGGTGRLWFSDMHCQEIRRVTPEGKADVFARVEQRPSGLGWLPDGRLLAVSMLDRRVLRREGDAWVEHADLSSLTRHECNDMVVDGSGRAYVGHFGFDLNAGDSPAAADVFRIDPDGSVAVAAPEMSFPNGSVITPDDRTLIVAETWGGRLTAFDIEDEGSLTGRRVWAELDGETPDGICLDADGCVWVASPMTKQVLLVAEGGEVKRRISTATLAIACMLGGDDGRTLFVCTAPTTGPADALAQRGGQIEVTRVDAPAAGRP